MKIVPVGIEVRKFFDIMEVRFHAFPDDVPNVHFSSISAIEKFLQASYYTNNEAYRISGPHMLTESFTSRAPRATVTMKYHVTF